MIVVGAILLIAGWFTGLNLLWVLGLVLLVVGVILWVVGGVGNRPRYW